MAENLGAWLVRQREARSWSRREMARQLVEAGRATGDKTLPGIDSLCHNIHRWERGQGGLTERYKLHYCTALGIPPVQFGTDPAAQLQPADSPLPAPPAVAYRGKQDPAVEREVLMAAHEGSDHAEQAGVHGVGAATFEQLHADLVRLSRLTRIRE